MDSEKKRRRGLDCLLADTQDGAKVDIARDFTWLHPEMTSRRRLFCYYVAMNGLEGKTSLAECARWAGYRDTDKARVQAAKLLEKTEIIDEIANLKAQIEKKLTKINISDALYHIVKAKVDRSRFNAASLYETVDGMTMPKPLETLTEQQLSMIEGVEYKGSIANYKVASKVQAENELIALWQRMQEAQDATGGYDVEATMRSLDGTATVKVSHKPFEYQHATNPSYEE